VISEELIRQQQARVGVIGLGYVGLPLAIAFAQSGFPVVGFDIDASKIDTLTRQRSYISYIPHGEIASLWAREKFSATADFKVLAKLDAILICVPTPLSERREPDLRFVESTARTISRHLQRGQLVVLESTSYPGTTEELLLPILEESGLRCPVAAAGGAAGSDFYLAYSPERIDPGRKELKLREIPKIVAGVNPESTRLAMLLYQQVCTRVVAVSSPRVAEMSKLLENIYRSVNIALVNELKLLCLRMGIDIWEVIAAAATKPFGFAPFYPGPGLGGHCIPIDPFYLSWKAKEHDFAARFIELAGEVNAAMPYHVVEAITSALNRCRKSVYGARILLLGVAYKKDIDDTRESPGLKIMQLLQERGAEVAYNDPYIPRLPKTRKYDFSYLSSVPLEGEALAQYDCVVIVTDHSDYDYERIVQKAQLIVDTRNATERVRRGREKVVRC